jgi:hypothetical protein
MDVEPRVHSTIRYSKANYWCCNISGTSYLGVQYCILKLPEDTKIWHTSYLGLLYITVS